MTFASCFATAAERHRSLPADETVPDPLFAPTHAITVDAPPEQVWPWIARSRRAGYRLMEARHLRGIQREGKVLVDDRPAAARRSVA
jgi:hypothetical protein